MVPLWSERGLIGLLLLGEKRDGSLYTQEEIEIARAASERLVDARAARELARRLLVLQRKRLADDHLQDARVRRALHDDVLPLLHTALLALSSQSPRPQPPADAPHESPSAAELLADAHRQIAGLLADLPPVITLDPARGGLLGALRRLVDDLGSELDGVDWQVNGTSDEALAALPPLAAEVLFGAAREVIRNAVRHGRADDHARPLHLWIAVTLDGDDLVVRIQDDGVGLTGALAQSDWNAPGSGQGLLLHGTLLTVLGGALTTESAPGRGMRVIMRVPR
jgi:signal transduction histidine kinase